MPRFVVIGGGITGLACALRLQDLAAASPRTEITLIEAAPRPGGKLVSHHERGFVVDAGADIFLASKPAAMELCARLGIADRMVETDPSHRRTFVRDGSGLVPATHYGEQRLVTPLGGMQELVDGAVRALCDVDVVTSCPIESITPDAAEAGYQVHTAGWTIAADAVVIAVPARAGALMLRRLAPDAAALLDAITYRSSFTVSAAYRAADVPHALDGYGYVVPDARAGEVSACTWTSSKIPSRAPAGHVLLRGYVHGAPGLSTDDARRLVLAELRRVLGIEAPPLFTRQHAWQDALPALDDDRAAARRAAVRAALTFHPGIAMAGGAVDGIGIPDSIRSGQAAAERVWHGLTISRAEEAIAQ
ncbi:MAG TPA: FAD-dependent oxidoreductase [Gemmatimonadaceae bacterium]|nr:FAD-dependent oxidoreductase [Gemmatimonadaceae bacterium]